jgi:hypothetical protein
MRGIVYPVDRQTCRFAQAGRRSTPVLAMPPAWLRASFSTRYFGGGCAAGGAALGTKHELITFL